MAHFAEIDPTTGVVLRVVVVDNKDTSDVNGVEKEHIGQAFLEKLLGGDWVQTSYNASVRNKFAGIGDVWDTVNGRFIPPKPYPSWTFNNTTLVWDPPVPRPGDASLLIRYSWNEETLSWDLIE